LLLTDADAFTPVVGVVLRDIGVGELLGVALPGGVLIVGGIRSFILSRRFASSND
jgi:hypothetical protein